VCVGVRVCACMRICGGGWAFDCAYTWICVYVRCMRAGCFASVYVFVCSFVDVLSGVCAGVHAIERVYMCVYVRVVRVYV